MVVLHRVISFLSLLREIEKHFTDWLTIHIFFNRPSFSTLTALSGETYQKFNNANSHYADMIDHSRFHQTFIELWKSGK